jgi:hypothetical protein
MPRPRRAVQRRLSSRILVSASLIAVTAAASLVVWRMSDSEASIALPADEPTTVIDTTTATALSPTPSATTRPSPSATPTRQTRQAQSVDWSATVENCRNAVQARDTVIDRAATGIGHWSQHIDAQTDANAGRISVDAMAKTFLRTRLLGPGDVSSYRDALDAARNASGECGPDKGSPSAVGATLAQCAKRLRAQTPVLAAGARGMADWNSHLAAMRRNKQEHVHNAQQVWIDAWRAAPPKIKAFDRAAARFKGAAAC